MNIAILGTGEVGSVLGRRWAERGHAVCYGSRDPHSERVARLVRASGANARASGCAEAAAGADVIVLATPWPTAREVIASAGDVRGKTLVDCTNPLNPSMTGFDLGPAASAAEQIAEWAPGAHVVKAFNNVSVSTMADPIFDGNKATMFYCGDDAGAKRAVHHLTEELDLEPVDAGPLYVARFLEPMAMLYIQLAVHEGWGSNCAFKIMRR